MKKIIVTVAALFAFGFANAQNKKASSDSDISYGVKAGLNIATVTNQDNTKSLMGFHVSGLVEFKINDKFSVQPEVMYSTQGTKFDGGQLNLDYINVPIMAKYYVVDAFSIEAGPQIGFLMSAKAKADSGGSVDVKDQTKSIDFGLDFGAGYKFTENIFASVRYELGLTQLQKDLAVGDNASNSSVFQISVGYKF